MKSGVGNIYTRRGDKGLTQLLSRETVGKADLRVKCYGSLDELQSHLGFVRALVGRESVQSIIYEVQEDIFVASAELASTSGALPRLKRRIDKRDTVRLEGWIDEITSQYGLPKGFVSPGKYLDSSALHVARAVCRRSEREIVMLNQQEGGYDELLCYFNRLSDLLFMLAWSLEVHNLIEYVVREAVAFVIKGGGVR